MGDLISRDAVEEEADGRGGILRGLLSVPHLRPVTQQEERNMIKIINGKRYNTETAEKVASYGYGYVGDFKHYEEELYLTPKGSWFLVGEGGAMSKYAESMCDGGRCGGEGAFVLSPNDALAWLEAHEEIDAIETHFGSTIEDA